MAVALKPLKDQIIVITGASSGIGLATAREAARRGAKVVLAARNEEALAEAVRKIEAEGGEAIHVVADVSRKEDLEHIADAALQRYGGFDTWVNNAAAPIYGRLEGIPEADHRRLFDVNFWGLVCGSLIAVQHLRRRGGGAIINLGSMASDVATPLLAMYSASKHAVKGFTDGLRSELEADGAPISVTLIKPTSIDTPFPQHARNYLEVEPRLPPPIYAAEEVAHAICYAAAHPKRDIYVGGTSRMFSSLNKFAPRAVDFYSKTMLVNQIKTDKPPRDRAGNLERPGEDGHIHGEMHGSRVMKRSLYTRAAINPMVTAGVLGALGLAAAFLGRRRTA